MAKIRTKRLDIEDLPLEYREAFTSLYRALNEHISDVRQALDGGVSSENMDAFRKTVSVKLKDDWEDLNPLSGWINVDNVRAGIRRDVNGTVFVRGVLSGAQLPAGSDLLQLPRSSFPAHSSGAGPLSVSTSGTIFLNTALSGTVQLGQLSFPAADPRPVPNASFPISFKNELTGNRLPTGVQITSCIDTTDRNSTGPVAVGGTAAFRLQGSDIMIDDVPGLVPGRSYTITFMILGS